MVDVAVQQPLLPVPHKDDKRPNVPVSEHAPHHEIRYHPTHLAHEQMMIHQQQLRQQAEMQRRHQQNAANAYHQIERERREEQIRQVVSSMKSAHKVNRSNFNFIAN